VCSRSVDRQGEAQTRCELGDLLHDGGETASARRQWQQALTIFDELGDPQAAGVRERLNGLR
jgi:hypothetical protein